MTDILQLLSDRATSLGHLPIIADAASIQQELLQAGLEAGDCFVFIALPTINRGISSQTYNGDLTYNLEIMLGRKNETETFSSVNETAAQKYENRLFELMQKMNDFLNSFFCSNEIEELSTNITMSTNIFSINVDAVVATVSLRTWNQ